MKKKVLAVFTFLLVLLCGCSEKEYSSDFFAMDTVMSIKAYGKNAKIAVSESQQFIGALENKISRTKPDSDIGKLNASGGKPVTVNDDTLAILKSAVEFSKETDGAFDVTVAKLSDLWQIGTENQHIPLDSEIADAKKTVDYKSIEFLADNQVQLKNGTHVDLGGIGKGYAADKVVEIMRKYGVSKAIIALSGNVYVLGEKAPNAKWNVGIADPDKNENYVCSIGETDKTVVTSGDYERFFEKDGVRYHHIFDPKTGYPANTDLRSVSIITDNSAMADAYSTALFVMGYEKAMAFYKVHDDFEAIFITQDKKIIVTDGLKNAFSFNGASSGYIYEQ